MGRRESTRLNDYMLEDGFLYEAKTVTKGTQKKYFDGQYFYKINKMGNEGLCEYIAYVLLSNSSIDDSLIAEYEYCKINGVLGCRSKNFLCKDEVFITAANIYKNVCGRDDFADSLLALQNAKKRLDLILDVIGNFGIDRKEYKIYLNTMMQLDLLTGNVDRHIHNYGIILDEGTGALRMPPLFDNGRSLDTDRTGGGASTLSGSFIEQVTVFGFPVEPQFSLDIRKVLEEISPYADTYEYGQLENRINKFGGIFASKIKKMYSF